MKEITMDLFYEEMLKVVDVLEGKEMDNIRFRGLRGNDCSGWCRTCLWFRAFCWIWHGTGRPSGIFSSIPYDRHQ